MMEAKHRDFAELQRELKERLECLLTIRDVRSILAVSANVVIDLIRDGEIEAYDLFGNVPSSATITPKSNGIRISPESLLRFMESKIII